MWVKLIFIGIIAVIVAFKDAVYIFYYEMYLKYCQDTDVYRQIYNLLLQWKIYLWENARVACLYPGAGVR